MDITQLKTFVTVAKYGTITDASSHLNLSQPAVSAHIKALEESLALRLFKRTARGMTLTFEGEKMLPSAQAALNAHTQVFETAATMRLTVSGRLRIAAAANAPGKLIGDMMIAISEQYPGIDVYLSHEGSHEVLANVANETLDAGFCVASHDLEDAFTTLEVARFGTYLVAPVNTIPNDEKHDWRALEKRVWVVPDFASCCGKSMEELFHRHNIRPSQTIKIDRESVTETLVSGGVGLGILHADSAAEAVRLGQVEVLCEVEKIVKVLFVLRTDRKDEPVLKAATTLLRQH